MLIAADPSTAVFQASTKTIGHPPNTKNRPEEVLEEVHRKRCQAANPVRKRLYYGHLYDIISTSYNGLYMSYWANHLGNLLPAQNFAGHLQFITTRSDWVLNGAPDAVMKAIPKVSFAITTNGGGAMSVTTPSVSLDGTGWIDIDHAAFGGAAVALVWTGQTTWQASVDLKCGANSIQLDALDRQNQAVGSDTISVTRTGAGCP